MGGATRKAQPRRSEGGEQRAPEKRRSVTGARRSHLGRGLLAALLLHAQLLVPLMIATFIYAAREEAERPDEVDVGFEDVPAEELPQDLPPLDDTPAPVEKAPQAKVKDDRKDPAAKKPDEKREKKPEEPPKPEEVAKEKPQPEVPVPPESPPPQPPAPTPQPKMHEKIVDLDNDKEVEPPKDAKYLAQKNNRAEEETRATQTNLDREQKGGEGSQEPEGQRRDDKEIGDDRAKIAQLEEQKSKLGRAAPEVTPQREAESLERVEGQRRPSPVLSLRQTTPRGHEITPETVDPSLPHDPAGMLARARQRGSFHDHDSAHKHDGSKRVKLALSGKDYEYLFGGEAKADRQLAQKERSTRIGKHVRGAARVRSALENFINEVKPGNQTALNTRAAPFAAFIARMHRNIHQLWGFGALEDWDELPSSSPLNDESLVSTLEIELNRDGTVNKVSMVRPSKYLPFDAAAIDVVLNAAPYPEPPREIRSGNGKIYVHWSFFRDGRQCATSGVDYFILNNGPKDGDGEVPGAHNFPASPSERGVAGKTAAAEDAPRAEPGAVSASTGSGGPRRLERGLGDGNERRLVTQYLPGADSGGEGGGGVPQGSGPLLGDREARGASQGFARDWFSAFVRGDIGAMTSRATFPFRSSAGVAATSREELAHLLRNLVAESPGRSPSPVTVETAAGLRKMVGKLPPGLDDGAGTLFAVSRVDGDMMIVPLARTSAGWKASGLVRR